MEPGNRSVQQLLAELRVPSTLGVVTGRMPAIGASATLKVATEQARRLAEHPEYYADSGSMGMLVTKAESDALLADGAASDDIQNHPLLQARLARHVLGSVRGMWALDLLR